MSRAARPSEITLPPINQGWDNLFQFVCSQFPRIAPEIWAARLRDGKMHWHSGEPVTMATPFLPSRRLCYYREVVAEPVVAAPHQILYQDEHILLACKPHGLPVIPGGEFVNECLLERLRRDTGLDDIAAVHRLDRDTAGLVLFSLNPQSRPAYYQLFATGQISKTYQAVAQLPVTLRDALLPQQFELHNRIEKSQPRFLMQIIPGEPNAHSTLQLLDRREQLGLFRLTPHTGKTHQLRLHMQAIGCPILYDPYYPHLLSKNVAQPGPLQLLAQQLQFIDPVSGLPHAFCSPRQLDAWQRADG
ncbi:MAG: pseudouridine synthase [Rheinheimera sp.]|nr:pseudouridine synthase [Rheinheimera sp.]